MRCILGGPESKPQTLLVKLNHVHLERQLIAVISLWKSTFCVCHFL